MIFSMFSSFSKWEWWKANFVLFVCLFVCFGMRMVIACLVYMFFYGWLNKQTEKNSYPNSCCMQFIFSKLASQDFPRKNEKKIYSNFTHTNTNRTKKKRKRETDVIHNCYTTAVVVVIITKKNMQMPKWFEIKTQQQQQQQLDFFYFTTFFWKIEKK